MDSGSYSYKDIVIETRKEQDCLKVSLTAQTTPVSEIRLRWHFKERVRGQVLGDAWERAYADLGRRG